MNFRSLKLRGAHVAAVLALILVPCSAPGQIGTVQMGDTDFFPGPWTNVTLQSGAGGTAELRWELFDGNPSNSGRIRTVVNGSPSVLSLSQVYAFFFRGDAFYDPLRSGAAIRSLSYAVDLRFLGQGSGEIESTAPAIRQGERVYAAAGVTGLVPPVWTAFAVNNLTAANFIEYRVVNGQVQVNAASHPDFGGGLIQFGFLRARSNTSTGPETHEIGIDNWNFTLTTAASQTIAVAETYRALEGRALVVPAPGVLANDINRSSGQLAATLLTGPSNGDLELAGDGSFTYTPRGSFGFDTFEYSPGGTTSAIVTINVATAVSCQITTPVTPSGDVFALVTLQTFDPSPLGSIPVLLETIVNGNVATSQTRPTDQFGRVNFTLPRQLGHLRASFQVLGYSVSCEGDVFVPASNPCLFGQLQARTGDSSSTPTAALRRFRDEYLARQPLGRERIQQYYRHSPEVMRLMGSRADLLPSALNLYRKYQPLIQSLVAGERPPVTRDQIAEVGDFLRRLEPHASGELRLALQEIRRDLLDPRTLAMFGVDTPGTKPREVLANLPLRFEENRGQADASFDHLVKGARYEIALAPDKLRFHGGSLNVTLNLAGADARARSRGEDRLAATSHYLLGRDRAGWLTRIPNFAKVRYSHVYPGIDLVYYGRDGRLEYDFLVAPGSDPRRIALRVDGAAPRINDAGDLMLAGTDGQLRLHKPVVYQQKGDVRTHVPARFRIGSDGSVGFEIAAYDRRSALVIDPVLTYASYLGGQASDTVTAIALGGDGSIYLTGSTASSNFPVLNPLQSNLAPGTGADVFVTKLNAAGNTILYSTYLGGADEDTPLGIAVDSQGSVFLTGATRSVNFPVRQAFQPAFGGGGPIWGTDAFVARLDPSGSSLTYSTYLGGTGNDAGRGIALATDGSVTIAGVTASPNFPIASALQSAFRSGEPYHADAFVTKLTPSGSALVYSTFLGGTGDDMASAIALDFSGNVYVTGLTHSSDFPTLRPLASANAGGADVFVSKLKPDGSALLASTYFGGEGDDMAFSLALGRDKTVYLTGVTGSPARFPRANAAQLNFGGAGGHDAFVARMDLDTPMLVYSTPLGGSDFDTGFSIGLDLDGNAYVAGITRSRDFASGDAPYPRLSGSSDSFIAKLEPSGRRFAFRSYLGGAGGETALAMATNPVGSLYFAGSTTSANFPVTSGAVQSGASPLVNGFLAKLGTSHTTCSYAVSPTALNLSAAATAATVTVTTGATCAWSAKSLQTWATITSAATGVGPGVFTISLAANTLGTPRSGGIDLADGAIIVLNQAGTGTTYPLSIQVAPANGGTVTPASGGAYGSGAIVTVVATPAAGFAFTGWSGPVGNPNSASTTVTMDAAKSITANFTPVASIGLQFVPVAPCRVADTRLPNGSFGGPALTAGGARSFTIPQSSCGVPATAQAYSLNVTVVPSGPLAYLTLWPSGQAQPFVSTLNSFQGFIVANAAIVPAGSNGAISVFATNATHVILDINGYFASAGVGGGQQLYKVTPCRVTDTRLAAGPFGGPSLAGGNSRAFQVPQSPCGVPAAGAYAMNATVVPSGALQYLTLWPTGQNQPFVSTLNSFQGQVVANAAIVPAGTAGAISAFVTNPTELVLDVNGYFGNPGGSGGLNFYPVAPCRVTDTRLASGPFGGPAMSAGSTRNFVVPQSACGIPASAQAYAVNVTVVPSGPLSFLTAWPGGVSQPLVSTLNSFQGRIVANAAIVPAGANGSINIYVTNATDVVIDISGYFAP